LIYFCKEHSFGFNEIIHRKTIDNAIKISEKYNLKLSDNVIVTKKEMDIIRNLPSKYGKVLFVIIVTAKHSKSHPNKKVETYNLDNNKYYSYHKMRELVGLARLSMSEEEMLDMCQSFAKYNSYIKPIEGRDYLYEVLCIDEDGEEEIVVKNMNNIIEYFPQYCEKCGKIIEKTGKRQKYCKECWKEIHKEIDRNLKRQKRAKE
jgi:Asp-tRNA(Asn)/Glu-tRNA(Gln) amidotransferase C subunit